MTQNSNARITPFSSKKIAGFILGPGLFFVTLFLTSPAGMSDSARAVLASTMWIAAWWITEAIPIPVTSLLPIILFPLTGGLDIKSTTTAYGHPMMYLFIGGLIIAVAIERWNLHKRIAMNIISAMGTESRKIILGFMIATALLSMWISNTATTLMMMPIGIAVIIQLSDFLSERGQDQGHSSLFGKALMLSIAYSASIGGMATLIGTPPNLVLSGIVKQLYNIEITFSQWMMFGLPVSILLLIICWAYMVNFAFPLRHYSIPGSQDEIKKQLKSLGKMSWEEKCVLGVFTATALAWISRSFILNKIIPGIDDTVIALCGAAVMFLIPAKSQPGKTLLEWDDAVKIPWGIILLFGGGFALAAGFKDSGLAEWIGTRMSILEGVSFLVALAIVVAMVNFLTEVTSNTSTTTITLPIFAALSFSINSHPLGLMVAATVGASCAFMLPVATPPNAVVFGSGYVQMQDMVKAGIWMNLISIIILTLLIYFLLPLLWGIDLQTFPAEFRR